MYLDPRFYHRDLRKESPKLPSLDLVTKSSNISSNVGQTCVVKELQMFQRVINEIYLPEMTNLQGSNVEVLS